MIEIYDNDFDEEVLKKEGILVLVDFSAPWCQPCRMMEPLLKNIEEKFSDKLIVRKYDVEKGHNVAGNHGVNSLPTLILFKSGKVLWTQMGLLSQAKIEDRLKEYL
jgi:thioredoxin 1